ncbi:MAG: hypothetical protein ACRC7O_15800 [Fimbriiglobus sp.]
MTRHPSTSDASFSHYRDDDGPVPQPDPGSRADATFDHADATPFPEVGPLGKTHDDLALDFVNPRGFGLRRDGKVAGFASHGVSKRPADPTPWKVQTVDLVGLLLRPEPVVYVSDHLPRMDELKGATAPTRPLDRFEADGLAALRTGDDLYAREAAGRVRMIGAVRAAKQCVECHGGSRGDLLGAFAYTFARGK